MIIDIPSTTSSSINKKLVDLREKGGANTQGRVLTLVIVTDEGAGEDAIEAANGASFEHPCRVIVVAKGSKRGTPRLDAQIRVGGDAGASEVIVLRLYGALVDHGAAVVIPLLLPDAPVVAWWPGDAPDVPSEDPIGKLAQRRITDANIAKKPIAQLQARAKCYKPGDTDLAWTRLTMWRGLLASVLDQPPHEKITSATVTAAPDSVSAELLAGWLALTLRVPIKRVKAGTVGNGLRSVELFRRNSEITLARPDGATATLTVTGQPARQLPLPHRILRDCIAEELRRLDADDVYAEVLDKGITLLDKQVATRAPKAVAKAPAAKAVRKAVSPKPATDAPAAATAPKPASRRPRAQKPAETPVSAASVEAPAKATRSRAAAKPAAAKPTAAKPAAAKPAAAKPTAAKPTAAKPAAKAAPAGTAAPKARATRAAAKPAAAKPAAAKPAAAKAAAKPAAAKPAAPKATAAKPAAGTSRTRAAKATPAPAKAPTRRSRTASTTPSAAADAPPTTAPKDGPQPVVASTTPVQKTSTRSRKGPS